jgi:hypothetical protein
MSRLNAIIVCLDVDDDANESTAELIKEAGGIAFASVFISFQARICYGQSLARWAKSPGPNFP